MAIGNNFYTIVTAMVPLYVAMFLGYGSVKWWKIFNDNQCAGINRFVSIFSLPSICFIFISYNNPYTMNFQFLAADTLQKIVILAALGLWAKFAKNGSFDWTITIFSLSTLPNTFVIGIPLLNAMYGEFTESLMVQIVVMQFIVWYTLVLFLFEIRGARNLIMEKFPENGLDIASIKVDSDVVSLDGHHFLETESEVQDDGKLRVTVRRSNVSRRSTGIGSLSGVEIYSLSSSAIPTPCSSFNQPGFCSVMGLSNFVLDTMEVKPKIRRTSENEVGLFSRSTSAPVFSKIEPSSRLDQNRAKDLISKTTSTDMERNKDQMIKLQLESVTEDHGNNVDVAAKSSGKQMPSAGVMSRLILIMVWRKLIRNPNTYSSIIGLIWSLVSFRWDVRMPKIIENSITMISDGSFGLAMFSLGLFMALQPKLLACGRWNTILGMVVKFLLAPVVMLITSLIVGLRGTLLYVGIVQATLCVGIVPFVYAKEYDLHPTIVSTAVIFGMLITVPITVCYYILIRILT
ncbi:probable auxin efflux carrier component 1c [Rutidosis leptorrhynchoides]|uniref:probable auxin efflux carrier component 1c n=1 Tax=Rutidosis leptorrhynchoides TaxID=125765 RepID=UPI003A998A39